MPGSISQVQMMYHPEEDRILLRVNSTTNQQFRFWITRRFALMLTRVLAEYAESDPDVSTQGSAEAKQAVKQFKHEQAIDKADFNKPFKEEHAEFPLGEEASLAFRLSCNRIDAVLKLGIHPKKGEGITLQIDRNLNTSISQLLQSAVQKAQWNLGQRTIATVAKQDEKPVIN
jgi:hypothetical protein